ncbi:hypothetical protein MMC22_007698 [Lobaria immixta]|nr:hypothetical protein [Lobaria immixta]
MSQTISLPLSIYHGSESGKITLHEPTARELGPTEVAIKISHSGICFTDSHNRHRGDCGLGHEGAGIVTDVGTATKHLKVGDRVGAGYIYGCITGFHQYCDEAKNFAFSELDQGTLGNFAIRDEGEAYKIPDAIESKYAGPLMCAGPTVYQALLNANLEPNATVGIVGVGGLGHLAVQFAKAMGYTVVVYSQTDSKRDDAFKLGADEFYTTKGVEKLVLPGLAESKREGVNALIFTTSEVPDLNPYLHVLAKQAWIIALTVQLTDVVIPSGAVSSRQNAHHLLDFCAKKGIRPWIEEFPLNERGLNEAFDRLESGKMRYRAVAVAE